MNTQTIQIAPVQKTLTVKASQARAFEVFTERVDAWWPRAHHLGATPPVKIIIEPRLGGRWYAKHEGGEETTNGHVLVWEPPSRVVFSWEISPQWKESPGVGSEVEIRFIAGGPNATRVELLHHKFEVMGEDGGKIMRAGVENGWTGILELFKKEVEA
jgi:uncharacterized protein YndB with AHSA1/START domain